MTQFETSNEQRRTDGASRRRSLALGESDIRRRLYDEREPSERPKYGSLNFSADPYGASPRFGSSYFRLAEHTLDRTTFCFPDSVFEP